MPFNNGVFTPRYNWSNEAAAGNPPASAKFTTQDTDIATALSTCILADGTQTVLADIPMSSHKFTGMALPSAAGQSLSWPATGSFTGTLTGMTGSTTGTVSYLLIGPLAILYLNAQIAGTSNSTAMTLTGLPAAIQPVTAARVAICGGLINNGGVADSRGQPGLMLITSTIDFIMLGNASNPIALQSFTASGTKGLVQGFTVMYPIT